MGKFLMMRGVVDGDKERIIKLGAVHCAGHVVKWRHSLVAFI